MSSISAGTTTGTALVSTGDTSGVLYLQTNNGVNAVTIAANQYVGIGTTTPAYLLDVAGTTRTTNLTLTNPLGITSGGTGLTSLTANGVLYANSSSALTTGSALTFDGTNLGIGLATPSGYGISPRAYVQQAADSGWKGLVIASAGSDAFIGVYYDGSVFNYSASYGSSAGYKPQAWQVGGSEQMRLTSTGLGIGTSSPTSGTKLTLQESASNPTALALLNRNSTQTWKITVDASAVDDKMLAFIDDNTSTVRLALTDSGNLGLGVTPSAWDTSAMLALQVGNGATFAGDTPGAAFRARILANAYYGSGEYRYIGSGPALLHTVNANSSTFEWNIAASGTAGGAISFTQAMTLDPSGNFLVGTTSQLSTERFSVVATGTNQAIYAKNAGGDFTFNCWNSATSGNNQFIQFITEASPTARGSITYNRAGGLTAYNVTSDYRAKDIYGPVTDSGVLIDSVPVYMGKMKGATHERPMFIAHETPEYAHTGEKDAVDADGNPVYQQMDASALIPVMWAEIQSLRKRLAALEAK